MIQLLKDLDEALDKHALHSINCKKCQLYFKDITIPKCDEYLKLEIEVNLIRDQIEAYKIDID